MHGPGDGAYLPSELGTARQVPGGSGVPPSLFHDFTFAARVTKTPKAQGAYMLHVVPVARRNSNHQSILHFSLSR